MHFLKGKNALCDYLTDHTIEIADKDAHGKFWGRILWDVTAVAWLLNDNSKFMDEKIISSPIPEYNSIYTFASDRHEMKYIYFIKREALLAVGGFPAGMKIGEDLYLWILLARRYPIAFSPKRLVRYRREAENRSTAIYTPEKTEFSFEKLYDPTAPLDEREFVARAALGKALILCAKGDTEAARRAIETFRFTTTYRRTLRKVQVLNRLPVSWRQPLLNLYNRLAWVIAKKGL